MITKNAVFLASMPNLSLVGLSENWLLKECGNQHWMALAEWFDRPVPDFTTAAGLPVYAAFVAVKVADARLDLIQENHHFSIETRLANAGRARFYSSHRLVFNGKVCAHIEMLSTQVARLEMGNNQSVVRADLTKSETQADDTNALDDLLNKSLELANSAKAFRRDDWKTWHELTPQHSLATDGSGNEQPFVFCPCPHTDFNGADFLYFASFQAAADRAEWNITRQQQTLWSTTDRQLNYYGNINIGDALILDFMLLQQETHTFSYLLSVKRESDGVKIADIVTRKQRLSHHPYRWAGPAATLARVDSRNTP